MRHDFAAQESFVLPMLDTPGGRSDVPIEHPASIREAAVLEQGYNGQLRPFFREHIREAAAAPTLEFLATYDQACIERGGITYSRLSFGANTQGDIFCILAANTPQQELYGSWHNIFSLQTQQMHLEQEATTVDTADVSYRYHGGDAHVRKLRATLDNNRRVRFILSREGNRCEELNAQGEACNTHQQQLLSSCLLLRHEITHDQKRRKSLGEYATATAA